MTITATYDPADDKLRLSASQRLDAETYTRVKAAGYGWAPKQGVFYAVWSPSREDLALELAGEIGDEDTTLVDRAEARAERFEDYSDSRREDANQARAAVSRIADGIPLGQPILIGHHSERHARKDAERIENGMRRAVKMWETSKYWQERAAGAIAHAKYKELPAVRARRIKGLESEKRGVERDIANAEKFTVIWSASLAWDPEVRKLTREQARSVANFDHVCSGKCFPLKDYPRNPPASQYEGAMGLWSALGDTDEQAIITPEQARDMALRAHAGTLRRAARWLQHLNNRLEYERAMLAEGGGLVAQRSDIQIGGKVKRRGEWLVVLKLNKRAGELLSVTVSGHWATTVPVDEITGYEPPAEGDAEKVSHVLKLAPLCNYPGEGFKHVAKADLKKTYSTWIHKFPATATHGAYRSYSTFKGGGGLDCHNRIGIYITDQKRKDPPALKPKPDVQPVSPAPLRAVEVATWRPDSLDRITDQHFYHYENGKIKGGIKYNYSGEGESECYQYATVEALIEEAQALQAQARILSYSVVTHQGEYKGMRTIYKWDREAEAFGAMADGLRSGVAVKVVSAPQLFPTPAALAERMVEAAGLETGAEVLEPSAGTGVICAAIEAAGARFFAVEINHALCENLSNRFTPVGELICRNVLQGDFLEQNGNLGKFDAVIMNPPFSNGADIKHIQHALTFLKPGRRLVAICANGPRQQAILKPLAEDSGGYWEDLPAGTFADQGTGVNTALLVIEG